MRLPCDIEPEDRAKRIALIRLVPAFPVACKLYLRSESVNSELGELVSRSQYLQLKQTHNLPLQIVFWIADYLQQQYQRGNAVLHYGHVVFLQATVKSMMESVGHCERILRTPLPLAYIISGYTGMMLTVDC